MDIEKLKAEFEQSECFKRLEHVAQYTFFEFGAYIKRTDVPADIEKKCGKLITALLFSWSAWKEAKAQAVPEGCVVVPKENISCYWQDNDEPENFCSNESDFDCLGDCIDLGEIMEINKFTQAHVNKEILFGTWFAEAIDPSEKANFFVGTHAECLEIVAKNKAMIEARELSND